MAAVSERFGRLDILVNNAGTAHRASVMELTRADWDRVVSPSRAATWQGSDGPIARSDQRVHVEFEGHDYQLVVSVVPDHAGWMYVRPLTCGPRRPAPVAALKLLGCVGG